MVYTPQSVMVIFLYCTLINRFDKSLPTFPFCSNICFQSGLCEISTGSDVDLANEVSTLVTTAVHIRVGVGDVHFS